MSIYDPEKHIKKYGEAYRKLIVSALEFLEERTPAWGVAQDEDSVDKYIEAIMERAR